MVDQKLIGLLDWFIEESWELIDNCYIDLIDLEHSKKDPYVLNRILRTFHSIKGNANMLKLSELVSLTHQAAKVLILIRDKGFKSDKNIVDVFIKTLDYIKIYLPGIKDKKNDNNEIQEFEDELKKIEKQLSMIEIKPTKISNNKIVPKIIRSPKTKGQLKTLIVEDDFINRHILNEILSEYGLCHIAVNGEEAVNAFSTSLEGKNPDYYDLICMDIVMDGMDGLEAVRRIRKIEKENGLDGFGETIIIMVTGVCDPKTVIKAYYKSGANSYLVKPIIEEQMELEIQKLILQ